MNREKMNALRAAVGESYDRELRRVTFVPTDLATVLTLVRPLLDALLEGGDPAPDVGPHAGMGVSTAELFGQRLTALEEGYRGARDVELIHARKISALEAYRAGHDAYDLEVHGSLKALEGRLEAFEGQLDAFREQGYKLSERVLTLEATVPALETVDAAEGETIRALEALRTEWAGMLGRIDAGETMQTRLAAVAKKWRPMAPKLSIFADLFDALLGPPDVGHGATLTDEAFTARLRSGQPWASTRHDALDQTPSKRGATPCPVCGSTICMGDPKACDQRAAVKKAKG